MTTTEVADRLVALCRQDKFYETQEELYADDCVSIEANDLMLPKVIEGLDGIRKKGKMFEAAVEKVYERVISEPVIGGDHFAVSWSLDADFKGRGRMTIIQICVYKVHEGKIVLEQFFY